jgi:general secretion pathway protein C
MKRYYTILSLIFITAAIYLSVKAFYKIAAEKLDDVDISEIAAEKISSVEDKNRYPVSYYISISRRNLFNTKTAAQEENESVDVDSLKKTELNLRLWGTVTGDKGDTYAVIEDPQEREQNLYRAGDTIQKATVKMILREKVVLLVDGQDEILEIEKAEDGNKRVRPDRGAPRRNRAFPRGRKVSMQRSQIKDALGNVNELMQKVKVQPHFKDGEPDGIQLSNIQPGSIFRNMGLVSGDVISAVDGKKIQSVEDAMELYKSMKSASNFKLEVQRSGRLETMDYRIK